MELRERIQTATKEAMKARDGQLLSTLRLIGAAIKDREIAKRGEKTPALMAAYYIFAHDHPPAKFGMLTGAMVGLGSAGNILGAAPLVSLIHAIGWRPALWLLVGVTLAVSALLAASRRLSASGMAMIFRSPV